MSHKQSQYKVLACKCQIVATIFITQLQKLSNVSQKHIRKLFHIPTMQYMLSRCSLFYFLYLTDLHCTESMHEM